MFYTCAVFISCVSIRKYKDRLFHSPCIQPEDSGIQEVDSLETEHAYINIVITFVRKNFGPINLCTADKFQKS